MRFDFFRPLAAALLCLLAHETLPAQVQASWNPLPRQDLGIVEEEGGVVERRFVARNTGSDSWQVLRGYTSCGCTAIEIEQERVVRPSDSTLVIVRFNPASKSGSFRETVTIQLSDGDRTFNQQLVLTGEVRPSQQSISWQFPLALGDLRISTGSLDFGEVRRNSQVERHIALCNTGAEACAVRISTSIPSIQTGSTSLTLPAGATHDVTLIWDGNQDTGWGLAQGELTIATGRAGQKALVRLAAILLPDFSSLSAAQLANAPQLKTERRLEVACPIHGKASMQELTIRNTGGSPLQILSAYSSLAEAEVLSRLPLQIEPGKTASIEVRIIPGSTTDIPITLISTDARKPRQTVRIYLK